MMTAVNHRRKKGIFSQIISDFARSLTQAHRVTSPRRYSLHQTI